MKLQASCTFAIALARLAEISADIVRGNRKLARVVGDDDGGPKGVTREMWFVVPIKLADRSLRQDR